MSYPKEQIIYGMTQAILRAQREAASDPVGAYARGMFDGLGIALIVLQRLDETFEKEMEDE